MDGAKAVVYDFAAFRTESPDGNDQMFAFPFLCELRYQYLSAEGVPMSQLNYQPPRKVRSRRVPANEVHKLLNALLAFDRTLVEFSMDLYKVPRRDRAAMRKLNRRLHSSVRERLPQLLHQRKRIVPA